MGRRYKWGTKPPTDLEPKGSLKIRIMDRVTRKGLQTRQYPLKERAEYRKRVGSRGITPLKAYCLALRIQPKQLHKPEPTPVEKHSNNRKNKEKISKRFGLKA